MKTYFFCLITLLACAAQTCFAQNDCENTNCRTNSLIINTGYNHSTSSVFSTGQQDPYWILVDAPTSVVVNLNGPANVIQSVWGGNTTIDNTNQYISAFTSAGSNLANVSTAIHPYSFQRCFCVCGDKVTVKYDFTVRVDNQVKLYIDGILLTGQPAQLSTTTGLNFDNTDNANNRVQGSIVLNAGRHCLRADVRNDNNNSPMGLDIKGTLSTSGNNLLKEGCCNKQGFIVGYKFRDENCDGRKDPNEPYLSNWQIQVSGNSISQTTTTDANGYYTFTVPAGTYTVSEVMQNGWSATTPANGTQSGVVVTQNGITRIDFGNCPKPPKFCCPGENMVVNGDFESGNVGFTNQYTYNPTVAAGATLPGQYNVVTGQNALTISSGWVAQDPSNCPNNTTGKFLVVNGATCGGGQKVIWQQTFTVEDWMSYKFCASAKNLKQCDFDVKPKLEVNFSMAGIGNMTQTLNVSPGACNWYQFDKNIDLWGYGTSLTIKILLDESTPGDGNDVALDNIALIKIPKCPVSAAMFQIQTTPVNATDYNVNATSATAPDCDAIWWEVCEYDMSTQTCITSTTVSNIPAWWFVNTNFPTYNAGTPGIFKYGKLYKITRGTWGKCHGWTSFSRFVGSSLATKKVKTFTEDELKKSPQAVLNSLK